MRLDIAMKPTSFAPVNKNVGRGSFFLELKRRGLDPEYDARHLVWALQAGGWKEAVRRGLVNPRQAKAMSQRSKQLELL